MISVERIQEILAQYKKHGWILRRVLLSDELRVRSYKELTDLSAEFGAIEFVSSQIDAAWFSRPSGKGGAEAWELRRLDATPYALFEVFADTDDEDAREETRKEMENRMKQAGIK